MRRRRPSRSGIRAPIPKTLASFTQVMLFVMMFEVPNTRPSTGSWPRVANRWFAPLNILRFSAS